MLQVSDTLAVKYCQRYYKKVYINRSLSSGKMCWSK